MIKNILSKLPNSIQKVLENKYTVYVAILIMITHIVGYILLKQWNCLALFGLTASAITYFIKSRTRSAIILVIFATLFISNWFGCYSWLNDCYKNHCKNIREGSTTKEARYYKNKAGKCIEHTEPKKANGGCKGMGCTSNCKVCKSSNTCS